MKVEKTIEEIRALLTEGACDRKSPFHILSLAYHGDTIACCSVVLQSYINDQLLFHTHRGSSKVSAFSQNPGVCLMGYDKKNKFQIRLNGDVVTHYQNNMTKKTWLHMKDGSKLCYQLDAPSLAINQCQIREQSVLREVLKNNANAGYDNFVVCEVNIKCIDFLYLNHKRHLRWMYTKKDNGWIIQEVQA